MQIDGWGSQGAPFARPGGGDQRAVRVLFGALLFSLVVACGDSPGEGTPGELGAGTFDYRCENSGDLKCSELDEIDEFQLGYDLGSGDSIPAAVAVGATFGIRYAGSVKDGNDGVLVTVDSVSAADKRGPNAYAIEQPAEAAFVATDGDGKVVDFAVVTALEATELGIWHDQDDVRTLRLDVGETLTLTVAPRSDDGTFLAGALPYEWRVLDGSIAGIGELNQDADDDSLRNEGDVEIRGISSGSTTLRVRSGDLEARIDVEVQP